MKERPILFSAPMVRAILDGRKTQTRRIVKCDLDIAAVGAGSDWDRYKAHPAMQNPRIVLLMGNGRPFSIPCPYGQPGDRLWVRETWRPDIDDDICGTAYRADGAKIHIENSQAAAERWLKVRKPDEQWPSLKEPAWRSSIHMPRWASRLTLEITGVRVERLQAISEADARAEGCWHGKGFGVPDPAITPEDQFPTLWESINGPGSWNENPWVWVIEFKRI